MKIKGTETAVNNYSGKQNDLQIQARTEVKANTSDVDMQYKNVQKDYSQMPGQEKDDLTVSNKTVFNAIENANKAISLSNRRFEYSIHDKTNEIMIKVIDSDTDEVIREIPPEKILDIVAKMWEMAGLIVDEKR